MAVKYSIIKSNTKLKQQIVDRIKELNWNQYDIPREAAARGYDIPIGMLNKYLKHGNYRGALREDQIIWLATRLGISIKLYTGNAVVTDGPEEDKKTVTFVVPPYSEEQALKNLKIIFPDTKLNITVAPDKKSKTPKPKKEKHEKAAKKNQQ